MLDRIKLRSWSGIKINISLLPDGKSNGLDFSRKIRHRSDPHTTDKQVPNLTSLKLLYILSNQSAPEESLPAICQINIFYYYSINPIVLVLKKEKRKEKRKEKFNQSNQPWLFFLTYIWDTFFLSLNTSFFGNNK